MKLYAVMYADSATNWQNFREILGTTLKDGVRVYIRRRDAKQAIQSSAYPNSYRIVVFETTDKGGDARRTR